MGEQELLADKHVGYIVSLDSVRACKPAVFACGVVLRVFLYLNWAAQRKESFEYWVTEHLKVQGLYWGVTALELLGAPANALDRNKVVEFLKSCQHEGGAFSYSIHAIGS